MNLENDSLSNRLLFIGFNQDQGCFACGTEDGFAIYNTDPVKLKEKHVFENENGGIAVVEMLFRCNYLGLIGGGPKSKSNPNTLMIWDDLRKKIVVTLPFSSKVVAVRLRRDRIVVVLEDIIHVWTFTQDPQQLHIFQTANNPNGLCALSPSSNMSLLAFPAPKNGVVQIIDLAKPEKPPLEIIAHQSLIGCMNLDRQGKKLATASEKGTLIRIFDTLTGSQLQELRRGAGNAKIYCMNFNQDASMLCLSSDHGTIHVFAVDDPKRNKHSNLAPASSLVKYFGSQWSCARAQLPTPDVKSICAFGNEQNTVIVLCADGSYYKYKVNSNGETTLENRSRFI